LLRGETSKALLAELLKIVLSWARVRHWRWRERPMRRSTRLYGPDELEVIEQIVDAVFYKLSREKRLDTAYKKRLRERVSKQVFKQSNAELLEVDAIRQRVLAAFKN
jgi:hypothetical protein